MRNYKKIIAMILVFSITFLQIPNLIVYAAADTTPPTIDVSTLKVDKTEATVGESVKVSIKATDEESGIKSINVYYYKPITGDIYDVTMNYNTSEDIYEGYINIDENTISGLWEIDFIVLKDNNNNSKTILNSNKYPTYTDREDFSAGV